MRLQLNRPFSSEYGKLFRYLQELEVINVEDVLRIDTIAFTAMMEGQVRLCTRHPVLASRLKVIQGMSLNEALDQGRDFPNILLVPLLKAF